MTLHDRDPHGYRLFTYDKITGEASDLHSFVRAADLSASSPQSLDITLARALRLNGFLIARAEIKQATLVWRRDQAAAQQRYMLYLLNRGAVDASGVAGTNHSSGAGVGLIYPGKGEITLRTLVETDITIFTFDEQAIHPHALESDPAITFPPASPVIRAASAFFTSVLSSRETPALQSAHVLRRMTADVAIAVLSDARDSQADRSIRMIRQLIEANFMDPRFSIHSLCEQARMSRRTLERTCAEAGFSPSDALRFRRTEHALKLLLSPDRPRSTAVWQHTGFGSSEQMRRAFLHYYGRTPKGLLAETRLSGGDESSPAPIGERAKPQRAIQAPGSMPGFVSPSAELFTSRT